ATTKLTPPREMSWTRACKGAAPGSLAGRQVVSIDEGKRAHTRRSSSSTDALSRPSPSNRPHEESARESIEYHPSKKQFQPCHAKSRPCACQMAARSPRRDRITVRVGEDPVRRRDRQGIDVEVVEHRLPQDQEVVAVD